MEDTANSISKRLAPHRFCYRAMVVVAALIVTLFVTVFARSAFTLPNWSGKEFFGLFAFTLFLGFSFGIWAYLLKCPRCGKIFFCVPNGERDLSLRPACQHC